MEGKKTRKANYTDGQIRTIIGMFSLYSEVLMSKLTNTVTNEINIWRSIADAVNYSGEHTLGETRTVEDVKKSGRTFLLNREKTFRLEKESQLVVAHLPK